MVVEDSLHVAHGLLGGGDNQSFIRREGESDDRKRDKNPE